LFHLQSRLLAFLRITGAAGGLPPSRFHSGDRHVSKFVAEALLLVSLLSACGQKGPLVLPPPEGMEIPQQQDQNKPKK
jgi:predicted small lipoprotein YifL